MITDLVQIRRLEQQKRGENARFRAYLKSHRHSDRRLRRFGEEIEAEIDCTAVRELLPRHRGRHHASAISRSWPSLSASSEREFVEQFTALR